MNSPSIPYATLQDWRDVVRSKPPVKIHEIIERLGLRAKWGANKRGKSTYNSAVVKIMVTDIDKLVERLPKDAGELVECLSAPGSLDEEIDDILKRHGAAIWGRGCDRDEHLVSAGTPGVDSTYYPRDLYYEEEEDRALLRTLLHWWTGLKAFNVLTARKRVINEKKRREERKVQNAAEGNRQQSKTPLPIAPAARSGWTTLAYTPPRESTGHGLPYIQPYTQTLRLDTSHSNSVSPMNGTPVHSDDSPVGSTDGTGNEGNMRRGSFLPQPVALQLPSGIWTPQHRSTVPIRRPPSLHHLGAEIGSLVLNFMGASGTAEKHQEDGPAQHQQRRQGLDLSTLQAFRAYIYPSESGPKWDEVTLLRRLEREWRDKVRAGHNGKGGNTTLLFAARDRAFLTWIELRRHLADLTHADECWRREGDCAIDLETRIAQHKTLMSTSRDLVRSWDDFAQSLCNTTDGEMGQMGQMENGLNGEKGQREQGLTADDLLVQAFILLAGDNATPDMLWTPMNMSETVRWLRSNTEQFAAEEAAEGEKALLYVRT